MGGMKLLVVDNAKNQRELYRLILEDEGYEVTTAHDGEQALLLINNNSFDLILADDKTTGTQELLLVIDLIRRSPSAFVLMIITGSEKTLTHGSVEVIKAGLRGAMFNYIEKPVDRSLLLSLVKSAMSYNQLR